MTTTPDPVGDVSRGSVSRILAPDRYSTCPVDGACEHGCESNAEHGAWLALRRDMEREWMENADA